jgi:YD repeat-containing protein
MPVRKKKKSLANRQKMEKTRHLKEFINQVNDINYKIWNTNTVAPQSIWTQVGSNTIDERINFLNYDLKANLLEQSKKNDVKQVFLWGYKGQYPVAKIINTTSSIAQTYITQSVLDNPTDDASLRAHLNNLRNIPGAMVTTYTYLPLIGITSETDPGGKTKYYEYDGFNRLLRIRDKDGNILKQYDYKYQY